MGNFFHTVTSGITLIFGAIVALIVLIFVLVLLFKLGCFIYGLFRFAFMKMTAGVRHRHAILKSLANSENNSYENADSLYEQHLHLAAGIKNADENKMWLGKYQKRMMVQLEKTTTNPDLEASKVAYLDKNSVAIAKAKAKAKARGDDSYDFDMSSPVYIFGDFDFDLPDFDFPDFGGFDINF